MWHDVAWQKFTDISRKPAAFLSEVDKYPEDWDRWKEKNLLHLLEIKVCIVHPIA